MSVNFYHCHCYDKKVKITLCGYINFLWCLWCLKIYKFIISSWISKGFSDLGLLCLKCVAAVQLLSYVQLFVAPWTVAHQASLSFIIFQSFIFHEFLKLMSIESVKPSKHLALCHPLLLLPSISPSIRVFSNKAALCIKWPKYWRFSISPSKEYSTQ